MRGGSHAQGLLKAIRNYNSPAKGESGAVGSFLLDSAPRRAVACLARKGRTHARAHIFMSDLREIFGPGGPLERSLPGFRPRKEQVRMAEQVAGALAKRSTLIVE